MNNFLSFAIGEPTFKTLFWDERENWGYTHTYTHAQTIFLTESYICSRQAQCCTFYSVQFSSVTQSCLTLCNPMNQSMPGLPVQHHTQNPPKIMSIESVMPSNHLILCRPLILLLSIFPSIRVFSNESALRIRWPKYYFMGW